MKSFRMAPMCTMIRLITLMILALPAVFVLGAVFGGALLIAPTISLVAIYSWVWLRFRPVQFVVRQDALEVAWPLKRHQILDSMADVRIVNSQDRKPQVGWGIGVGAEGLWGGFGWLWTQRRGIVQMYISRINDLVWIDRKARRPWLNSPDRPQEFLQALSDQNSEPPNHG